MRLLCSLSVLAIILAFAHIAVAEEENISNLEDSSSIAVEPATLIELDANVKDDGDDESVRVARQFGRPYYGGGFGRPRPYYGGGGFYRPPPRPFYGGGFYRPPRPVFYGGFYG